MPCASACIHVPTFERNAPAQNRRKLRCDNARNIPFARLTSPCSLVSNSAAIESKDEGGRRKAERKTEPSSPRFHPSPFILPPCFSASNPKATVPCRRAFRRQSPRGY